MYLSNLAHPACFMLALQQIMYILEVKTASKHTAFRSTVALPDSLHFTCFHEKWHVWALWSCPKFE